MFLTSQSRKSVLALALISSCLAFGSVTSVAHADVITLSGTWTGNEALQGVLRPVRDANPSVAATPKSFPGTLNANPTYFSTLDFTAAAGSLITITGTAQNDLASFFSIYDASFNPANLALNYLGDAGNSGNGTTASVTFSVFAPSDEELVLVASSVLRNAPIGKTYSAQVTFTPAAAKAVPEPFTLSLFSAGLLGAGALRRRRNKNKA